MDNRFGSVLKDWRTQRRLSQLELGLIANVSARHISFLETGRSRPSRSMILHLCEQLEVPRAARNGFLSAAGFAPAYLSRDLDEADMAHVSAAVHWMLERHEPFPAMALDRHWVIKQANKPAGFLLEGAGLLVGQSMLSFMMDVERMKDVLENWQEVLHHMCVRLRTESAHMGGDRVLDEAADKLSDILGSVLPESRTVHPAVIPARYRAGANVLSFFSTIAQFGSAEDIALSELKIELLFPADDATRETLLHLAGETGALPV